MGDTVVGHAGRYDAEAMRLLLELKAEGVVLLVIRGSKGDGFSCSTRLGSKVGPDEIPGFLRFLADAIEAQGRPDGLRVTTVEP